MTRDARDTGFAEVKAISDAMTAERERKDETARAERVLNERLKLLDVHREVMQTANGFGLKSNLAVGLDGKPTVQVHLPYVVQADNRAVGPQPKPSQACTWSVFVGTVIELYAALGYPT